MGSTASRGCLRVGSSWSNFLMRESLLIAALLVCPAVAGAQWAPATIATDAELRGLSAAGASVVWTSGTRGRYAHSIDGGRTWRQIGRASCRERVCGAV